LARYAGTDGLKELAVNRIENKGQHHRLPLLISRTNSNTGALPDDFKIRQNGFVGGRARFIRPHRQGMIDARRGLKSALITED
jgi:hypothetical protein